MTIRPAGPPDLAAISLIQLASPDASQWDPASYLDYRCVIAENTQQVIGFLVFRETGPGEHEILNRAVQLYNRRIGVASQLLHTVLAQSPGNSFLEVRASNWGAIRLYERMGFRQAGRRDGYYHDPSEPAIVMQFDS